ncbi:hypothetical protein [Desulfuromonas acetoxidans]|uniref:hypothetical protein n=1 Tax=Desulfuromonas acetoxidans TaxID=891 RepID=UPI00292E099C|nr:hypothetical protein [Desulfuromonas acetoxidans]
MKTISLALCYLFLLIILFASSSFAKLTSDYEQKTIIIKRIEGSIIYSSDGSIFSCTDKKLQRKLTDHIRVQYITLGNKNIITDVKNAVSEEFPVTNRLIHIPTASK